MTQDPRLARARQAAAASVGAPATPTPTPPVQQDTPTNRPPSTSQAPSATTNGTAQADAAMGSGFKLKFCTVCASNNNRSMEGHLRLAQARYPVISFGTGSLVRLPGPSVDKPNVYEFDKSAYTDMYDQLERKDPNLYRHNGILKILERNRQIKKGPERWHTWRVGVPRFEHSNDLGFEGAEVGLADVVITCEERCWDVVVDNLIERGSPLNRPVHVINMDIKDSHEEGLVGGKAIVDLANALNRAAIEEREDKGSQGWQDGGGPSRACFDERVPDILAEWQERWPQFPALWTMSWF